MLKTTDEIMIKFASFWDDFPVKSPEPPRPEELELVPPTTLPETNSKILKPIEIEPKKDKDIKPELEHGTAEWAAKNFPKEFLKGVKQPYRGFIRDPANVELVRETMDKLVRYRPQNYFDWDLYSRQELRDWLYPAAKALIKKDPIVALMKEIYRFNELKDLNTELWKEVLDKEISRSAFSDKSKGELFVGTIFNKMRHLAGRIATDDPEFYLLYIEGKPVTTKQFDLEARRVMKQKEELGKSEPIQLEHTTKL